MRHGTEPARQCHDHSESPAYIQRSKHDAGYSESGTPDTEAIHAKLEELLQADSAANNKVMRIDDKDAEEVERAGSQSLVATVQIVDAPLR